MLTVCRIQAAQGGARHAQRHGVGGVQKNEEEQERRLCIPWCLSRQDVVPISGERRLGPAEANLYGLVRASAETLGLRFLTRDLMLELRGGSWEARALRWRSCRDKASTSCGTSTATTYLWAQEKAERGELE